MNDKHDVPTLQNPTLVEMAAHRDDPALWATMQLTKPRDPPHSTVGEVKEHIRAVMQEALKMQLAKLLGELVRAVGHQPAFEWPRAEHSGAPWRCEFDADEHPEIRSPIAGSTLPGRVGVGVCRFHMIDADENGNVEDEPEQLANIALIVSAPELLAAARDAALACARAVELLEILCTHAPAVREIADRPGRALDGLDRAIDAALDRGWMPVATPGASGSGDGVAS